VDRSAPVIVGYLSGALLSTIVYVLWVAASGPSVDFLFRLGFAAFFWIADGFGLMLLLMIAPWTIAVWAHREVRIPGHIYFPAVGGVLVFILACATSSLAPKPLFVEDQTFLQGALIAAERQGISYLLAGVVFGVCYWWVAKEVAVRKNQVPAAD
jgi:hypothetical protein